MHELQPGSKVSYPIVSDPKSDIILLLNMVDPDAIDSYGNNLPSRVLYIIGPDKKVSFLQLSSSFLIHHQKHYIDQSLIIVSSDSISG